jgi:hypothetical protein
MDDQQPIGIVCMSNINDNYIKYLFSNLKCINTTTVWTIMFFASVMLTILFTLLYYQTKGELEKNNSLYVLILYFAVLGAVSLFASIFRINIIFTYILLVLSFMVLSFIAKYIVEYKVECPKPKEDQD